MNELTYKNVTQFFEKENSRIGNRISWLFATQTLIFGAFEYVDKFGASFKINFLNAIAQIGFWSSVCFTLSILAAAFRSVQRASSEVTSSKGALLRPHPR